MAGRRGGVDADMMVLGDGLSLRCGAFHSPPNGAFDGRLPPGMRWRLPTADMVELVIGRVLRARRGVWGGPGRPLPSVMTSRRWSPKLMRLLRDLRLRRVAHSVAILRSVCPVRVPNNVAADGVAQEVKFDV